MSRWLQKQKERELEEAQAVDIAVLEAPAPTEKPDKKAVSQFKPSEFKPGDKYKWKKKDNFYEVARRMNVDPERLKEYNEIEDLSELEPGIEIYVPTSAPIARREVRYEFLPQPLDMHVANQNGAKKWRFGNAKKWEDITGTGFYPNNTNVKIVAIAYVPIEDAENPELEAAYYMDALAVGDYAKTAHMRYTVGFMHSDLKEGTVVKQVVDSIAAEEDEVPELPEKTVVPVVEEPAQKEEEKKPERVDYFGVDKSFVENRLEYFKREGSLSKFVETYQPLRPHQRCTAFIPDDLVETDKEGRKFVWVHDFLTSRPDRKLLQHWEGEIAGTFEYEGVLYGRPVAAVKSGLWYGIPMDLLESNNRLYNDDTDTETKVVAGRLTWFETSFWVPLAKWSNKNKNKKG